MKLELAHDFIAKKVYEEASIEDKARARATKLLHDRYQHYLSSKNLLLTERELIYIGPFIKRMDLTREEEYYIRGSKKTIKKAKLMRRFKDVALVALLSGVVFSTWGFWERQRFFHASEHLASAQDSIHTLLRNQKGKKPHAGLDKDKGNRPSSVEDRLLPAAFFSTVELKGKITNEQDEPISEALIQIMGAQVYTKEDGSYKLFLIFPPPYIGKNMTLNVSKANYLPTSKSIDTDNPTIYSEFILVRE
ncbi:MAG: Unknown protein [uncultured Aureispira sp.]|uniref:Uncharacterized protein n=1 Tax=uncultured Aureispira sp. TaxID=1331704 RepID=A0A6S6S4L2_9BACT|nr:MAG: Unknown protein [uncultured Aureispira sp.]